MTGTNNIGEKIRVQRLIKNYSQEYMAYSLNISQTAYSNIERNGTKLSVERLIEIAEILEISHFELMPRPKFGTGINLAWFYKILKELKKFRVAGLKKRLAFFPSCITVDHSDKQYFNFH